MEKKLIRLEEEIQKIEEQKGEVNKKYFVTLRDEIISEQIEKLENGIYFFLWICYIVGKFAVIC